MPAVDGWRVAGEIVVAAPAGQLLPAHSKEYQLLADRLWLTELFFVFGGGSGGRFFVFARGGQVGRNAVHPLPLHSHQDASEDEATIVRIEGDRTDVNYRAVA